MTPSAIHQHQTTVTAAGVRVSYIPRSEGALVQITLDGVTHGRFFNHHGHALDVYRELVKAHTAPLNVGEQHVESVDRTVVTVQRVASGAYHVSTYQGTLHCEAWSRSYPGEAEARNAARRAIEAFAAYSTADAIAAHYGALTFRMRDALNSRRTTRAQLAAIEAQLDAVADLNPTIAALDALAA